MIIKTSDYLGNTTPILMNPHIGETKSVKSSHFETLYKAIQDGDQETICDLVKSLTIKTSFFLEHLSTYKYSENELKIITNAIFYSKAYDFLNDCLDAKINLILSDSFAGNPYINLLLEKEYNLFLKFSSAPYASEELLNEALDYTLCNNVPEDAKLLIDAGASLAKINQNRFITIYKLNNQLYRCIIEKLRLSPTPYIKHPGLLHQLTAANDNFPPIKDRAVWFEDLEELITLGFSPDQEINGSFMFGSALDIASHRNLKDVCNLFVKLLGRDPKNNELHEAILNENIEKIKTLLQNSPSLLFDINFNRQTPFDLLIENNKLNLLPLFASHCHLLKDETKNSKRITKKPVLRALKNEFYEMAQLLWDLGLDCVELDEYNLRYNFQNKNKLIYKQLQIIRSKEPKINSLLTACESDDYQTFKKIFDIQPWLVRVMIGNQCPSAVAVHRSSATIINFLHKSG